MSNLPFDYPQAKRQVDPLSLCVRCHQLVSEPHVCPAVDQRLEADRRIAVALERIAEALESSL